MLSEVPEGWSHPTPLSIYVSNETRKWNEVEALPYIGLEHIEQGTGGLLGFGESQSVTSAKNVFEPGDVLFGKLRPNLRKYWKADRRGICSTDILVLRGRQGLESDYLFAVVQSEPFLAFAENDAAGTKMPRTSWKRLETIELPIPPLNEQHRIAEILSSVDASIKATQAVIEQAERVKRGLMEELLTGGLGSKAIERGEVPEGWATLSLQSVADFITKGATPTTYGYGWESTGIPFFRSECVSERGFTQSGMAFISSEAHEALSRSVVKAGDLLISITGNVGRVAVVPKSLQEANINQHIARVRINSSEAEKKFIYYALSSPAQRRLFESIVTGQAYPQLSLKQIRETQVIVPPLREQRRVIQILSSIDDFITGQEKIIGQQNRTKRGLMDDLLTGKVRTV